MDESTCRSVSASTRYYVWHPEGADDGLRCPEFATFEEAKNKADEWNKEVSGHKVLEITEVD